MDDATKVFFERGLKNRKEVLGAEYVEKSIGNADAFGMVLQEFVTAFAWGTVWDRPGLPKKTRSMINLAMIATLGRGHELKLHINGALNNGVTKEEIAEIFLQVSAYAGFPAAVESFRLAREVFAERGE
jgi:4-carboxymuconolactone decarboxylase